MTTRPYTHPKGLAVITTVLLALFAITPFFASAQEASTSVGSNSAARGRAATVQRTIPPANGSSSARDRENSTATARQAALSAQLQTRIRNLADNLTKLMEAAINRYKNIATRMESRSAKLEAEGVDVTRAATHIEQAKSSLDDARAALDSMQQIISSAVTSGSPRAGFVTVRNQFKAARDEIKQAGSQLRSALAELKNVVADAGLRQGVQKAVPTGTTTND